MEATMRFMVIVKASKDSEAGVMPSRELLTEMGKFNEELAKAGVLVAGEGLQPTSKGARVRFSGSKRTVIDGPFAETKELIAGFWIWQVKSKEEAIEWVRRCPNPHAEDCEVEIRQIFEAEDFGDALTPEMREKEERMRVGSKERADEEAGRKALAGSRRTIGVKMKYMLLIYLDEKNPLSEAERQACYAESTELARELHAKGEYVSANPLHPTETATSVRVRDGKRMVTDGPFAETREQLGGYFLIDAKNLDEAIAVAGRVPMAKKGTVEVRPVIDLPGLPG